MDYKISVIIPVYNSERYLCHAMESLLTQTIGFENLQVIIVDDCSNDGSGLMIDRYVAQYPNVVKLCTPENSGSDGLPRNMAFPYVYAPYVMFLDSDDEFYTDACKMLYDAIERTCSDFVGGYRVRHLMNGSELPQPASQDRPQERVYNLPEDYLGTMDPRDTHFKAFFTCKIYKTSLIRQHDVAFSTNRIGNDVVFFCAYWLACKRAVYIDKPIYKYHARDGSMTNRDKSFFLGREQQLNALYALFNKHNEYAYFDAIVVRVMRDSYNDMLFLEFNDAELSEIFEKWRWLLKYCKEKKLFLTNDAISVVCDIISLSDMKDVLSIHKNLKRQFKIAKDTQ
jgi:poly(ribitol-phosphate) beta-N-acetylglucosaminyltransferase